MVFVLVHNALHVPVARPPSPDCNWMRSGNIPGSGPRQVGKIAWTNGRRCRRDLSAWIRCWGDRAAQGYLPPRHPFCANSTAKFNPHCFFTARSVASEPLKRQAPRLHRAEGVKLYPPDFYWFTATLRHDLISPLCLPSRSSLATVVSPSQIVQCSF